MGTPKIIAAVRSHCGPPLRWSLALALVGNMPSLLASSRPVIYLHPVINVHTGDFVAGLLGGVVVLLGVLLGELLIRQRERQRHLREAAWSLQTGIGGGLMTGRIGEMSNAEVSKAYVEFMTQLGRIRAEARWPIRNAKAIRDEVDAILRRFVLAVARAGAEQAGSPRLGPVMGDKLMRLIVPGPVGLTRGDINEALQVEGLPTIDDATADESTNVPNPPQAGAA